MDPEELVYQSTNELFVADGYGNHRVIVFDADTGKFKRTWGAFGNKPLDDDNCQLVTPSGFADPGPQQFSVVHAILVARDGTVDVADREYRRVQMFTKDGKFLKQLVRTGEPFARDLALSPDPAQPFLYVMAFTLSIARRWRLWAASGQRVQLLPGQTLPQVSGIGACEVVGGEASRIAAGSVFSRCVYAAATDRQAGAAECT